MEIAELLEKANDDAESMELIIKAFKPKVNAICRGYFLIGSDFDDILQEGMLGLYKAIQSYDKNKNVNFSSYASLCIHRQIQSAVKVANSKKNLPLNAYFSIKNDGSIETDDLYSPHIILVSKEGGAEKISLLKEQNSHILNTIKSKLDDVQFKILMMYLTGYSYMEIATVLDVKVKKVDNAIQTIKRKLKNITFE